MGEKLFAPVMIGIAIFLFILAFATIQYNKLLKRTRYGKEHPEDWLFHDFYLKVYSGFWGAKKPDEVAVKLGIKIDQYYQSCKILRITPNTKKLIVHHIYGLASWFLFGILALLVNIVFIVPGIAVFIYFLIYDQRKLDQKAEEKKMQIENELPRFLDLLKPELEIGMPIETAVYMICEKFDSLLSEELLLSMQEMRLGVSGWNKAIENVAAKYDVETLNDFAMDISTSYRKGIPVVHSVERKTQEIRKTHLLTVKERATKATNTILIPTMLFQFLPMMAFNIFPIFQQTLSIF